MQSTLPKLWGIFALFLANIMFFADIAFASGFNKEELAISDSIFNFTDERSSEFFRITPRQGRGLQPRYFVCYCKNFDVSFADGLAILQNYANYEEQFRYILRSQNTDGDNWFFILGINLVRTWLWGEVSEEIGKNSAKISFVQTPNDKNFGDSVRSLIVINFEELILQWNLIALDESRSRFCLTATATPSRPVPQWLVRTALRRIIPRTLRAIEH